MVHWYLFEDMELGYLDAPGRGRYTRSPMTARLKPQGQKGYLDPRLPLTGEPESGRRLGPLFPPFQGPLSLSLSLPPSLPLSLPLPPSLPPEPSLPPSPDTLRTHSLTHSLRRLRAGQAAAAAPSMAALLVTRGALCPLAAIPRPPDGSPSGKTSGRT